MKHLLFSIAALFCIVSIKAQDIKPQSEFFGSFNFGVANIKTSNDFSSWANSNGLTKNNIVVWKGISDIWLKHNWMFDFSVMDNSTSNPIYISNIIAGVGYKIANIHTFKIYGGIELGLNTFNIFPNKQTSFDATQLSLTDGSCFAQYSLLAAPHIMIVKNVSHNLNKIPNRFGYFAMGLDLGYQQSFFQSKWFYGYSNDRPFYAATVSGIPSSAFSGFYAMLKLGINCGRFEN